MSQRIEKGTKFTPSMAGMAGRRRPAPVTPSTAAGPSTAATQPAAAGLGSGSSMPPPAVRRPSTTAAAGGTTAPSIPTQVQPSAAGTSPSSSSSGKAIIRPSNAPPTAPTRSYAKPATSLFTPGASRAPASSSSASSTAGSPPPPSQRRPSISSSVGSASASTPSFKPPTLASSNANRRPSVSGSSASGGASASASTAKPQQAPPLSSRTRLPPSFGSSSKAAGPSAFAPRRPTQDTQSTRNDEQQPPTSTTTTTHGGDDDGDTTTHDDHAAAIDAALAHMNKTAASVEPQQNQFALQPIENGPEQTSSAQETDSASTSMPPPPPPPPRKRTRPKPASSSSRRGAALPEGHPPKPLSAYFLFLAEHRPLVSQDHPDAPVSEVAKLCGEKWRNLSTADKAPFEEQAVQAKQQYEVHLQAWKDRTPDWQDLLNRTAQDADADADENTPPAKRRKQKRRNGPKRPPSAYLLFAHEQRAKDAESSTEQTPQAAKETFAQVNKRIGDSWRLLSLEEKETYHEQAQQLKQQYDADLAKWQEDHPDGEGSDNDSETQVSGDEGGPRKRRRRAGGGRPRADEKSITDEEKEYEALVAEHGGQLAPLHLDTSATNMSDLATPEYRHGVASNRTFELDRVRNKQLEDALAERRTEKERIAEKRRLMKENLRKKRAGEEVVLPRYDPRTDPAGARRNAFQLDPMMTMSDDPQSQAVAKRDADGDEEVFSGEEEDVEEELGGRPQDKRGDRLQLPDLEDSDEEAGNGGNKRRPSRSKSANADDDSSDAESDAGSVKSATSAGTYHSLRDNVHAPQMRIVNGQIVLDETSLQIDRSQGADDIVDEDEVFEEEATHKFVNTATSSRREKATRWSVKETDEFYRAVSMWGTDFEMIARMFPNRSRKQIKSKWTKEERGDPKRLDVAFKRRLPVDLQDYAIMANVDLSGPPPVVSVNGKTEADLAVLKGGDDDEEDDGQDAADSSRRIKKASQTPDPFRRGASQGLAEESTRGSRKKSEREQRRARELARRTHGSTSTGSGLYEMEEEEVDSPPPE